MPPPRPCPLPPSVSVAKPLILILPTHRRAQEYFVVPTGAQSFEEGMRVGTEVYHNLAKILKKEFGGEWAARDSKPTTCRVCVWVCVWSVVATRRSPRLPCHTASTPCHVAIALSLA